MKRVEILQKVQEIGLIAVVRGKTNEEAVEASKACIRGGIKGIELTFTVPQADQAIIQLVEEFRNQVDVVIGAGTVLEAVTARLAILAGAQFIVSPTFDAETASLCNLYQIPYMPGCMTISEMKEALQSGVDIVKLFPGNVYGPSVVKAFKTPLPQLNIMPTGGVGLENMEEWFKAGVVAVGIGGNLLGPAETGDYDSVVELARQYATKYKEITGGQNG